jgi:hypothetical protein
VKQVTITSLLNSKRRIAASNMLWSSELNKKIKQKQQNAQVWKVQKMKVGERHPKQACIFSRCQL